MTNEEEEEGKETAELEEVSTITQGSSYIPLVIAIIPFLIFGYLAMSSVFQGYVEISLIFGFLALFTAWILFSSVGVNNQWNEAVILRIGKYNRTAGPGLFFLIPIFEGAIIRDMRIRTTTFSAEEALTKDNVPVNVDAVLFWEVKDSEKSVVAIQDFYTSITRAAMTTLRDVIGQTDLATLLSDRMKIDGILQGIIDKKAENWGLNVESVEIREVRIPTELQDAMSRQAQAERERQARIILGDSEIQIAQKFRQAAIEYEKDPNAMKLRAMNMLYEAVKERGSFIIVPSDAVNWMGFSGVLGATSLAEKLDEKVKKKHE